MIVARLVPLLRAHRVRRYAVAAVATILLLGVLGHFALPPLLRPWLEQRLSEKLARDVHIGEFAFNPYTLTATLGDVAIKERNGAPFLAFKSLSANAELWSLFVGGPVFKRIELDQPALHLVRFSRDRFNFSDLPERLRSDAPSDELPTFSLNNIIVRQGRIALDDRYLGSRQRLDALDVALPFLSTLSYRVDDYVEPAISGRLNGAFFKLSGRSRPFGAHQQTTLDVDLDRLSLPQYLAYLPLPHGLSLLKGTVSSKLQLVFEQQPAPRLLIHGHAQVDDLALTRDGMALAGWKRLGVQMVAVEPLRQRYAFGTVKLDAPSADLDRTLLTQWQQDAPDAATASDVAARPNPPALRLSIAALQLASGSLRWRDDTVQPAVAKQLNEITLDSRGFALTARTPIPLRVSATGADGEALSADLQLQPQPWRLRGTLAAQQLAPATLAGYWRPALDAELGGMVSASAAIELGTAPFALRLSNGRIELAGLTITEPRGRTPLLSIPSLIASSIALDSAARTLVVGDIVSDGGQVRLTLDEHGQPTAQRLLQPAQSNTTAAPADPPWQISLPKLALDDWRAELSDARLPGVAPAGFRRIGLQLANVDNHGGNATLALRARGKAGGNYRIDGQFVPAPFAGRFKLDLTDLDAAYAQPYFTRYLNITLASGFLSARGELDLKTAPRFDGGYQGALRVSRFHAFDKQSGEDFLKWQTLELSGVRTRFAPFSLDVAGVALSDFYSRLILSSQGRLNLQDIVVRDGQARSVTQAASAPASVEPAEDSGGGLPPIRIGQITLAGGNINFSDLFIQPNYGANLTDMAGSIAGLSTQAGTRATLELRGSVDRIAPVTVSGSLNPLADPLFIDIKGGVKGYDLTAASTYAAKYAGYGIEKGKLSMDVNYYVENGKLKASNQLFLDQLTLGQASGSPEATKLPVKFALALLTDRRGQIKLNLPIEGSLDDPQFRIGRVIWQIVGNLLEKIVTAPFDALASAFGDGPSLSHIVFEPGHATLDPTARGATQKLAEILADRPALKLDIAGWADPERDADGLKRTRLQDKLRALKVEDLADKGASVDEATLAVTAEEYPALLSRAYKQEKFPKPRNAVGLAKTLPADEMEKLILANTTVGPDDLRKLALARAQAVKDALKAAGVDDARLFVVTPKVDASPRDLQEGTTSRAQLKLQG
ncbi:DUF748 domain-containing protein [Chitinolyticbacter meiyuanensis]|uniref:DUF748 domain-containing protein n=1 Tax=Chitinolyticbacter meiyuanensis TaxID=682798 RepID=UPI0011E600D6|nr:DUF748 domain-containing protein [Chitinolyticbacter meiyuanensis]